MKGELAGALSERVMLSRRDGTRDALGGAAGAWVPVAILWAAIEPVAPGREVAGETIERSPRWRLTARRGDVRIGDRASWGGRMLEVRAVRFDPRLPDRIMLETEELR